MEDEITFFFNTHNSSDMSSLTVWGYTKKIKIHKEQSDLSNKVLTTDKLCAQNQDPEIYKKRLDLKTRFDLNTHQKEQLLQKNKSGFYEHRKQTIG